MAYKWPNGIPTYLQDGVSQPSTFVEHRPDSLGSIYYWDWVDMSKKTALQFVTMNNRSTNRTRPTPVTTKGSKVSIFDAIRKGDINL